MRPDFFFLKLFGRTPDNQPDLFDRNKRLTFNEALKEEARDPDVFDGGPPIGLQILVGLMKPGRPNIRLRMLVAVGIGWLPLLALTLLQSIWLSDASFASFISDYGIHARSLIAAPLLIGVEGIILPRLSGIVRHFRDGGLVGPSDASAFDRAIRSTLRLRDSMRLEILVVVLAITLITTLAFTVPPQMFPQWHRVGHGAGASISSAGWWHTLISVPILLILLLGWLWRMVLWARFLFLMSRLNLHLVPSHPDRAGGLKFVSISVQSFSALAFILGVIGAGTVANRVMHDGFTFLSFRYVILGLVIFCVVFFSAPLAMFLHQLLTTWRRGALQYGALARSVGLQMERRWLGHGVDATAIDANDFSATTDLYSVAANVYSMNVLPLDLRTLGIVAVATILPFVPVVLMSVSPEVIVEKLTGILL
jgi:hypothetical protein